VPGLEQYMSVVVGRSLGGFGLECSAALGLSVAKRESMSYNIFTTFTDKDGFIVVLDEEIKPLVVSLLWLMVVVVVVAVVVLLILMVVLEAVRIIVVVLKLVVVLVVVLTLVVILAVELLVLVVVTGSGTSPFR